MRASRLVLRLAALALAALALGACATQKPTEVQVGIGTGATSLVRASDYAALYAPYAMMATAAYTNTPNLNSHNCPDYYRLNFAAPGESPADAEYRTTVRGWVAELHRHGWDCYTGINGALKCPPRLQPDCTPVGGLEYHVWARKQAGQCREVAIAFRGTDKGDLGDWISNFRWLNRLVPKFDQYAQVQDHITQMVRRIKHYCPGANTQFVSVGHSLGGGLAQQAAYAERYGNIKYVYGFDPSPVTGFFDVSAMVREHSTAGLGVDRAYEEGEILSLPRAIIENIFPPADCHPRIRSVRFHVLTGLPGAQHSIEDLTKQLKLAAHQPGANPRRVYDAPKARDCKGEPMMVPPA